MPIKQVLLGRGEVKAGPEDDLKEGEFIVYPSTFIREPDSYGDIVAKGAFEEGIAFRKENGISLPGLFGHNMYDPDYFIAGATEESEDDHGWRVRGMFDLDDDGAGGKARKVYNLVKSGRLRELSFAYHVLDERTVTLDSGQKVNELLRLDVHEFSFVPIGANRDTSVVAVKSAADALVRTLHIDMGGVDLKAGRVLSAKNESALRAAYDSIGAVLSTLTPEDEEPKAGAAAESKDEEPTPAKSEDSTHAANVSTRLALAHAFADAETI